MKIRLETDRYGRWLAEIENLPGAFATAPTRTEAVAKVKAVSFRILAHRVEHGLAVPPSAQSLFTERSVEPAGV